MGENVFVITADQRSSRSTRDLVAELKQSLEAEYAETLTLPPDRNAGDEIQVITADAATALDISLQLARRGRWSIGVGVGEVDRPLPAETREASGPAFIAAREAVTAAKKRPTRFALRTATTDEAWPNAGDAQALIDPLLELLQRRSAPGWQLYDTMKTVTTQAEAAELLAISPAAVSDRARAAALKIEREARTALVRLLTQLER